MYARLTGIFALTQSAYYTHSKCYYIPDYQNFCTFFSFLIPPPFLKPAWECAPTLCGCHAPAVGTYLREGASGARDSRCECGHVWTCPPCSAISLAYNLGRPLIQSGGLLRFFFFPSFNPEECKCGMSFLCCSTHFTTTPVCVGISKDRN